MLHVQQQHVIKPVVCISFKEELFTSVYFVKLLKNDVHVNITNENYSFTLIEYKHELVHDQI